jgi:ERCC4-type nuclease
MLALIIDNREQSAVPLLEPLFEHSTDVVVKTFGYKRDQLHTGDFIILRDDIPVCCIERKTLEDFAASIKDGRYVTSTDKMVELRLKTGCLLLYIVENDKKIVNPDKEIAGIKYAYIEAAMDSLLVNHGIATIKTDNIESTMIKIINLMKQYNKQKATVGLGLSTEHIEPMNASELSTLVLNKRPQKTIKSMAISCLSTIHKISNNTAESILSKCSIMEFLKSPESFMLTTQSGMKVSSEAVQNIINISTDETIAAKFISAIDGISIKMANQIVKSLNIMNFTLDSLSNVQVGEAKLKNLGDVKAQRILDVINYKYI